MRYWLSRLYESLWKAYSKTIFKTILVIDTTLPSDRSLHFRKNLLEAIWMLSMIIDKVRDEKLQYDINKVAAKISALPSGKIDK